MKFPSKNSLGFFLRNMAKKARKLGNIPINFGMLYYVDKITNIIYGSLK
jgi:hypothetical protein